MLTYVGMLLKYAPLQYEAGVLKILCNEFEGFVEYFKVILKPVFFNRIMALRELVFQSLTKK